MAAAEPPAGDDRAERLGPDPLAGLPPEVALARLPPGRHGLPRSFVAGNQRLRLIAAMLRVLPRHGYPATTIGHITGEAGVSRAAFYNQFSGKEACFLATYDVTARWLFERIERVAAAEPDWPARVRAGVLETLQLLAANPAIAGLVVTEAPQAGPAARRAQRECLARLAALLRADRPAAERLPAELEEMLIGGVVVTVGRYVDTGRVERLPEAARELLDYLLIPYLEPADRRRVIADAA